MRVDERCEESYIGLDDFCLFFAVFFKFCSFALLKGKQTPLSNSKIVKVTKSVRLILNANFLFHTS